jgi:hypothetical protein
MAQATAEERELIDTRGCIVKDVIAHILLRCEQTGMALTFARPRLPSGLAAAG